ncbi:hypothetical protein HYX04_02130 [Candidatus Woesearchaeota archaeon]|nr:hypothetical protein [Candidatus Woesearchaeota archaeon]
MTQAQAERVTYQSKAAQYKLDPNKVFEVVAMLGQYIDFQNANHPKVNPDFLSPSVSLQGNGRKLVLSAEAVNQPGFLTSFDLATLVLSEDGKELTFEVHEHPRVAIDPKDLEYVANQYKLK